MGNKLEVTKITFHCKITDTFDMYNFLDAFYTLLKYTTGCFMRFKWRRKINTVDYL